MADESPSVDNLIEELGFFSTDHQFLLRLYGSSDPFAGLPSTDLEASYSQNPSGRLSSTSIAHRTASTRLWQDIPSLSGERPNQLCLPPSQHRPSSFREGLEGRDLAHYEEEWTSLLGIDSESLFEILQQRVLDDENPYLGSPELPVHSKASENVASPGAIAPPSPSVYNSEIGEPPDSFVTPGEIPGTQGNRKTSQDLRTLNNPGSLEQLLQSFPSPPSRNQAVGNQRLSHVYSDYERVPPKDSAQANTSTLASSQIKSVTSLPRISQFSEDLGDCGPVGEQKFSSICAKTDTSALDTSGLGNSSTSSSRISPPSSIGTSPVINTRNVSFRIPPPSPLSPSNSPSTSPRELRLPIDYHERRQVKPEGSHQAQERGNRYTIFPEYPSRARPISYVIRRQRSSFNNIFQGRPKPTATPRYYQKTPLRISSGPSTTSFASGKRSTLKGKGVLKRFVKKLKHLLCQPRKRTPSAFHR
ncbi:uncharacterized protein N7479_008074 [Penicillium vulpinum]|uniref:uncharacterized protein n=1 Tax=Penicillium vulpinum TaxID=29845 RepID=UPI002546B4B2|nr:uncharacterized protein N7479_008074 [Penicillium vulpinum]KAJ5960924.1 hypothetical protein N7479_008074 [Penicillium vulpinum]